MTSGAEEFKAFEAAGWSRRANTYGRVTGAITAPVTRPHAGPDPFRFADDAQLRALLDGAGLEDVAVETVAVRHRVEGDAMELWDGLLAGSVRSAAAVEALNPAARERAGAAFAELVEPYRVAGGHELPAVAKLGSARGP